ncbi:helix-turn-helix transcriptional regulator [Serratia marcescens]
MNNIAKERIALGLTQEQLATIFGWRQSRISNYENGNRQPGLPECRLIVETLNKLGRDCTLDSLFPPQEEAGKTEA